jgi:hypothetical protein
MPNLAFILSLPRSGSTVLTALLDRIEGVVCTPESSFPQILGQLTKAERSNPEQLAALYLAATFTPTPLDKDDAAACMIGADEEILTTLGLAVAAKLGRDPERVRTVVWKTPRTVGMLATPLGTGGNFIIIRRNLHNVYESQFRVEFGTNNRKPFRFAVFRESYENAFARIPAEMKMEIDYDQLPDILPAVASFIGIDGMKEWTEGRSNLEMAAATRAHMSEVTSEFHNRDTEKRARLDPAQVRALDKALAMARPLRPFLGPVRYFFDRQSLGHIRQRVSDFVQNPERS